MFKHKKLLSLSLATTLTMALALPSNADFSDLDGHWAESYMEDLHERGYLSGYEDDTMRPEGNITGFEALVFLSRFYSPSDDELEYIVSDYDSVIDDCIPKGYSWAEKSAAICLAAGIVSEDELSDMELSKAVSKELFSVMLVRALGLEDDALKLGISSLDFGDKDEIQSKYCGHVALLKSIEIVTGDDNNNFTPKADVTRAMAATFVSRALDYVDENDIELYIENYAGLVRSVGVVDGVTKSTVIIRSLDGILREYDVTTATEIIANDKLGTDSSSYIGYYVSYAHIDGKVVLMSFDRDSDQSWYFGKLSSFYSNATKPYIYLDDGTDSTRLYFNEDKADLYVDGKDTNFNELSKFLTVAALVEDDNIYEMYCFSDEVSITGTISEIDYGKTVTMKLHGDNGTTYVLYLTISDLPEITRDGDDISLDRLTVGTEIKVTYDGNVIEEIESEATELSMSGTLVSTTTTADGTYWTVADDDGDETQYMLDSYVSVYKDDKSITAAQVAIGSEIEFNLYGKTIANVEVKKVEAQSNTIVATVIDTNTKTEIMTVLIGGKMLYVDADCTIMNAKTGKSLSLSAVDLDSIVTIYGSYESASEFTATMIIIE